MDAQRLRELAADPTLISGIYNYCDRWCERCAFTERCLNFKWEAESPRDACGDAPAMETAMATAIGESLEMAVELMNEIADEGEIDLDALRAEVDAGLPPESGLWRACGVTADEVSFDPHGPVFAAPDPEGVELAARAAFGYARAVSAWFDAAKDALRAKADELTAAVCAAIPGTDPAAEGCRIHAALDLVRYYQHFIPIKLVRAVSGVKEEEDWPEEVGTSQRDSDGSAKAALLAMDRSIEGWNELSGALPEQQRPIRDLLAHLEQLRETTEARFSAARAFIRPGLDEQ